MPIESPMTFGVLSKVDIEDGHVVSIQGGSPLADVPESASPAWVSGAAAGTYAIGAAVSRASTHGIYTRVKTHSAVETTPPESDIAGNWAFYDYTERWRVFDMYVFSATTANDALKIVLRPRTLIDTIDLQGVRASSVTVSVTDGPGGPSVLAATTTELDGSCADYYEYFFGVVHPEESAFFHDVPLCADPVITIALSFPGNKCALGAINIGRYVPIGHTEYDTGFGFVSYSTFKEGADGKPYIKKRPGAGDVDVKVFVDPPQARLVRDVLAQFDALPTVWIAHPDVEYSPLRRYGVFDGRFTYNNYGQATLSGRIKGMV